MNTSSLREMHSCRNNLLQSHVNHFQILFLFSSSSHHRLLYANAACRGISNEMIRCMRLSKQDMQSPVPYLPHSSTPRFCYRNSAENVKIVEVSFYLLRSATGIEGFTFLLLKNPTINFLN